MKKWSINSYSLQRVNFIFLYFYSLFVVRSMLVDVPEDRVGLMWSQIHFLLLPKFPLKCKMTALESCHMTVRSYGHSQFSSIWYFGVFEAVPYFPHYGVIKWEYFPRYWPFVRGIPVTVNSPHKGQWCGTLVFSLICAWISGWVNNLEAGDLRRHHGHYDVTVMIASNKKCILM